MNNNKIRSLSPTEAKIILSLEWDNRFLVTRGEIIHSSWGE